MANSSSPKVFFTYPIMLIVLEEFLLHNNFTAVKKTETHLIYEKGALQLKVPRKQIVEQAEVAEVLAAAQLSMEEFGRYMNQSAFGEFEKLIDLSLKTPPIKKNKDVE